MNTYVEKDLQTAQEIVSGYSTPEQRYLIPRIVKSLANARQEGFLAGGQHQHEIEKAATAETRKGALEEAAELVMNWAGKEPKFYLYLETINQAIRALIDKRPA
jgi:hypothetical protein